MTAVIETVSFLQCQYGVKLKACNIKKQTGEEKVMGSKSWGNDRIGNSIMHNLMIFLLCLMSSATFAEDAVEAAKSCVVIHEKSDADGKTMVTCFENISLERTSFESGVCQWKTDEQAAANVDTSTKFVPYCPTSYTGYCDRLVLGPGVVAPVKIFLYDKSEQVVARAKKQCLGGGGKWNTNDEG